VLLRRLDTIVRGHRTETSRKRDRRMRVELEKELASARAVQQHQIPLVPYRRGEWEVTGCLLPCREVGGDLFDIFEADDGSLVVAVVDVSGHGLAAAMVASCIRGMLKVLAPMLPLTTIVSTINRRLGGESDGHYACIGLVRMRSNVIEVVNAGLPPISVISGDLTVEVVSSGIPPGLMDLAIYDLTTIPAAGAVRVVVATDGLTEAFGSAADTSTYLGGMGLRECGGPTPSSHELSQRAKSLFLAIGFDQPDDATVLVVDRTQDRTHDRTQGASDEQKSS
jgi:sigma-B regulation protein RsbU (phosphoserine phosphatase)